MTKFILVYTGDPDQMPKSEEEGMAMIEAWKAWYADIGDDLLDGGFPFKSGAIKSDGKTDGVSKLGLSGYLIIQADNYDEAVKVAKNSPMPPGGEIHVFEEQAVPGM